MTDRGPGNPRLGDLLVTAGVVKESELQLGLAEQRERDTPIGMTLVRLGFLDEAALIRALASQLNLPVVSLKGKRINSEILDLVSVATVEKYRCCPLLLNRDGDQQVLYLGIEDPTATESLKELSAEIGMPIQPVIVGPTELDECIHRHYHWDSTGIPAPDPALQATLLPAAKSPGESSSEPKSLAQASSPFSTGGLTADDEGVGFGGFVESPDAEDELEFVGGFDTDPNLDLSAPELFVDSESDFSDLDIPEILEFAESQEVAPVEPMQAVASDPQSGRGSAAVISNSHVASHVASNVTPDANTAANTRSNAKGTDSMLRAIAQLLIEKGVFTRDELVDRLRTVAKEDP